MTRNGKIARLPRAVRDELNQRLEDGARGPRLLAWLNERNDVRAVLEAEFEGRPINKQNLSEWRLGGFHDWQEQQHAFGMARSLLEEGKELSEVTRGQLLSNVGAEIAALALGRVLQSTVQMKDGGEKLRATLATVRELVRLRTSDRAYERAQREGKAYSSGMEGRRGAVRAGQTGSKFVKFQCHPSEQNKESTTADGTSGAQAKEVGR